MNDYDLESMTALAPHTFLNSISFLHHFVVVCFENLHGTFRHWHHCFVGDWKAMERQKQMYITEWCKTFLAAWKCVATINNANTERSLTTLTVATTPTKPSIFTILQNRRLVLVCMCGVRCLCSIEYHVVCVCVSAACVYAEYFSNIADKLATFFVHDFPSILAKSPFDRLKSRKESEKNG